MISGIRRGHLRTPAGNAAGPLASPAGVSWRLLGVRSPARLGTAPARGADWRSGRRRPGNGSGFSGGRDPPEQAAAAARAARGERRERRAAAAAAAGAERAHGRSSARPPELRRGGCLRVPGPARRLLPGLAGAGREPPGLGVPARCERSRLASKVCRRQRRAPVLSSAAARVRGQPRRHVRAVLPSGVRVKPRNLGAGRDPGESFSLSLSLFEFSSELIACSIATYSGLRRSTERAQRSAAIQAAAAAAAAATATATAA
ncbi:POLG alternative reading frame-like [Meriones unguiculatus]|uniref:POLG alternative reading frame-like n=1 Tax=Meriones unguiculatus TaxID=10047 RepID=UPI00293E87BB|nr:POLG alternative reading frame-like [Meriones unguiculatus]